jgi:hypothetical protein
MLRQQRYRSLHLALLVSTFGIGFLCGSFSQQRADAQLKDLGGAVMKQAGESGGMVGSAAQLATSVTEMQEHVTGLQKNIDTLKKVQSALSGQ